MGGPARRRRAGAGGGRELGVAGRQLLQPGYGRALVELSRGGADAAVVREFDLTRKAFVDNGFALPEAKSSVGWIDADTVYVGTDFGPGSHDRLAATRGRCQAVAAGHAAGGRRRRCSRARPTDVSSRATHDPTPGFERDFVGARAGLLPRREHFLRAGRRAALASTCRRTRPRRRTASGCWSATAAPWTVGGTTYPAGSLLAADVDAYMAGRARRRGAVRAGRRARRWQDHAWTQAPPDPDGAGGRAEPDGGADAAGRRLERASRSAGVAGVLQRRRRRHRPRRPATSTSSAPAASWSRPRCAYGVVGDEAVTLKAVAGVLRRRRAAGRASTSPRPTTAPACPYFVVRPSRAPDGRARRC